MTFLQNVPGRMTTAHAPRDTSPGERCAPPPAVPARVHPPGKLVLIVGLVWIAILGTGFFALAREEFTPVPSTVSTTKFPSQSALKLAADVPTLIIFAHPHCPCTRASFHELDALLATCSRRLATTVVFTLPRGAIPHWEQGELWQLASRMPDVRVIIDRDGHEAERFGVKGSGHVLLYQPSGQLVFSGGITPSRGHEGDNPGRAAVVSLVLQGHAPVSHTPVFGCPLLEGPAGSPSP